jgi:hypothetical protein
VAAAGQPTLRAFAQTFIASPAVGLADRLLHRWRSRERERDSLRPDSTSVRMNQRLLVIRFVIRGFPSKNGF